MREYDVLYTLSKCQQPVKLSELNQFVLLSQPALSRMVDRLPAPVSANELEQLETICWKLAGRTPAS